MNWSFLFFLNSALLGVGLAMDAFSVSIANAFNEPDMKRSRMCTIAGTYAFFQFTMPMIGWFCVYKIVEYFKKFQPFIPWIALILLSFIGGKMLFEGIQTLKSNNTSCENDAFETKAISTVGFGALIVQGIATSIDALSVGFTISEYGPIMAFTASLIIAVVTFFICIGGLKLGRKVGEKLSDKATIFGGIILIAIGLEIFIKGVFF